MGSSPTGRARAVAAWAAVALGGVGTAPRGAARWTRLTAPRAGSTAARSMGDAGDPHTPFIPARYKWRYVRPLRPRAFDRASPCGLHLMACVALALGLGVGFASGASLETTRRCPTTCSGRSP
jgi:hypothetical protein